MRFLDERASDRQISDISISSTPFSGALTVIVPVATAQVGCAVTLAVGAAGVAGWAATVKLIALEIQPAAFVVVTSYTPGAKPVNMPVVLFIALTTGFVPVTV